MTHPLAALGFRYVKRQGCTFWTPACLVQAGDEVLEIEV